MAMKPSMQTFEANSFLFGGSADYLEDLYEAYLADPNQVSAEWRAYFGQLPQVNGTTQEISHAAIRAHFEALATTGASSTVVVDGSQAAKQSAVMRLVINYRRLGHMEAKLDPLNLMSIPQLPELSPAFFGLTEQDLSACFYRDHPGQTTESLKEMITKLRASYCHHLGTEFMHMSCSQAVAWFVERLEKTAGQYHFSAEEQKTILAQLMAAETLETYLGKRFVGQKRFSLEGGDSLMPLLQLMLARAANQDVTEGVLGMAHRGRINVLINLLGKPTAELYQEFEGITGSDDFSSDVKYHKGYSADLSFNDKVMHLSLAFNPSHLEIVDPVVEGTARLRQERLKDAQGVKVLPILIHGDAAFAGQGVVAETLNMSQTRGFGTGGTIHIVINNQVGFTTSNPKDARSTHYATDIAKMIEAPVLHVNGDDPEAVVYAAQLALDYRMQFHSDVVIDLVCYRRHGHNESDEPTMTQPVMYQQIKQQVTPMHQYAAQLAKTGIVSDAQLTQMIAAYRDKLDAGACVVAHAPAHERACHDDWTAYMSKVWVDPD